MSIIKQYNGVIVPMISPFLEDFSIDEKAVDKIINSFIAAGVSPFIIGTTGESESMSLSQKEDLVKIASEKTKGNCMLFAGISNNSLQTSIEQANKYVKYGVDAVVSTVPYYYPANDLQLFNYFSELADSIHCPLIIYNMPSTTGVSLSLEVLDKLSYHKNIIGLKDSERSEERLDASLELWKNRTDFYFLIGWAAMSVYGLKNGADGIVPSTGNFRPDLYQNLYQEVKSGNVETANKLQERTNYLSTLYQKDRNLSHSLPALKVLMSEQGLCENHVLPPMYAMDKEEELTYREFINMKFKEIEGKEING